MYGTGMYGAVHARHRDVLPRTTVLEGRDTAYMHLLVLGMAEDGVRGHAQNTPTLKFVKVTL